MTPASLRAFSLAHAPLRARISVKRYPKGPCMTSMFQPNSSRAPAGALPPDMHDDDSPAAPRDAPAHTLVDRVAVLAITGLSKNSLLSVERNDPTFPQRVVLTDRIVRWYGDEVRAWLAARPRGMGHVDKPAQLSSPGRPALASKRPKRKPAA